MNNLLAKKNYGDFPMTELGSATTPLAIRMQPYFSLLDNHPEVLGPLGNALNGEIEIIRNLDRIEAIEKKTGQKVGILAENNFQIWIADPVKFPNGSEGIYGRFMWKQALKGVSGAVVLPVLPDGKILLISIYRHALRKWVLEIPRGNGKGNEVMQNIVKRELKEETGAEISDTEFLGTVNPDSGITLGGIPVVKVNISRFGDPNRDPAEQSINLHAFSRDELKEAIRKGTASIKINGQITDVEIGTDGFMLSALMLDEIRNKSFPRAISA